MVPVISHSCQLTGESDGTVGLCSPNARPSSIRRYDVELDVEEEVELLLEEDVELDELDVELDVLDDVELEELDVELVDVKFIYTEPWQQRIKQNNVSPEELNFALNHYNNVALSMIVLMQVHKPPRYNKKEFVDAIEKLTSDI
jgi:hypothetical protein